jgi:hypothetical protein
MTHGQIVMIYCIPYRCEIPDGMAKLIRLIHTDEYFETWEVEYLNNPDATFERQIKKT